MERSYRRLKQQAVYFACSLGSEGYSFRLRAGAATLVKLSVSAAAIPRLRTARFEPLLYRHVSAMLRLRNSRT
jgi:hypothetical protein